MQFHLGDILSITDGKLVSPTHMDGIYAILNYMTGDDLFTHQLPRAARECEPALREQHPELAEIVVPNADELADKGFTGDRAEVYAAWLATAVEEHGEMFDVAPLENPEHIDAIAEIAAMRPDAPILPIMHFGYERRDGR
jgi:hypothetical protein